MAAAPAPGEHAGRDQVVVQALLLRVETGVQEVVCGLLAAQYLHRVPVGAEGGQDLGLPEYLLRGEVDGEVDQRGVSARPAPGWCRSADSSGSSGGGGYVGP